MAPTRLASAATSATDCRPVGRPVAREEDALATSAAVATIRRATWSRGAPHGAAGTAVPAAVPASRARYCSAAATAATATTLVGSGNPARATRSTIVARATRSAGATGTAHAAPKWLSSRHPPVGYQQYAAPAVSAIAHV